MSEYEDVEVGVVPPELVGQPVPEDAEVLESDDGRQFVLHEGQYLQVWDGEDEGDEPTAEEQMLWDGLLAASGGDPDAAAAAYQQHEAQMTANIEGRLAADDFDSDQAHENDVAEFFAERPELLEAIDEFEAMAAQVDYDLDAAYEVFQHSREVLAKAAEHEGLAPRQTLDQALDDAYESGEIGSRKRYEHQARPSDDSMTTAMGEFMEEVSATNLANKMARERVRREARGG